MDSANDCSVANCSYILAYDPLPVVEWNQGGVTSIKFFLSAIDAQFVAIGFTNDISMRNSEIMACVKENKTVELKMFSWAGPGSDLQPILFTETQAQVLYVNTNYGVQCLVQRALIPWENRVKDLLNLNLFQIYLWGYTIDGIPDILLDQEPQTDWRMSEEKLKLSEKINFRHTRGLPLELYQMCGLNLTCIRLMYDVDEPACTYKTCSYNLIYLPLSTRKWQFFLSSAQDVDYVAVGLTHDKVNLLDTEIMGCKKTSSGRVVSFHYWISSIQQINNPQEQVKGLKLLDGKSLGGHLWCQFIKTIPTEKKDKHHVFYQLYLWGKTSGDGEPILTIPSTILASEETFDLTGAPVNHYKKIKRNDSSRYRAIFALIVLSCMIVIIESTSFTSYY